MKSRKTSRCSRCRPTRSTRRSPAPMRAHSRRSWLTKTMSSKSAEISPTSAMAADRIPRTPRPQPNPPRRPLPPRSPPRPRGVHGPKGSGRSPAPSGDRELPLQFAGLVDEEQNRSVLELRLQLIGFLVTEAESAEDLAQLVSRFVVPVGDEVVEIADVGADTLTDEAVGALLVVGEQMQGLLRHALRRQPVQRVEHADVVLEGLHGRLLGLSVHDLPPLRVDVSSPT